MASTTRHPSHRTSKQHFKVCFCFRRMFRLKVVVPPDEINTVFEEYSHDGIMTMDDMCDFLVEFQGENEGVTTHAQTIFDSLKHLNIFQRRGFHIDAFFRYLLSDLNGPLAEVYHDMTAPLAHYFLYTGHNSYLTGNQVSSASSTSAIINALKKGVRVIELDLWPNSRGDDVLVHHGGTLTSSVKLRPCLIAIKDYAFLASPYPVVITFEDHITPSLQDKVAKMLVDTFGDLLFYPENSHQMREFPSPERLKKKILISTKPPDSYESQDKRTLEEAPQRLEEYHDKSRVNYKDDSDDSDDEDDTPAYRDLISIRAGKPKGKLKNCLINHNQVRRLSLSEQELEDIAKNHGTDIIRFTQRNLLRIYPKGTRLDSSNYDPMIGWMHGAQMVAFNMQGGGHYLRYMEGMFRANGGCGYVKKPNILLNVNDIFDPKALRPVKTTLQVLVYMGDGWRSDFSPTHFDFYSPPDFRVQIGIHGVPADRDTKYTRTIEDDWVPVWNEEFSFPLRVPELALLYIKVVERDFSGSGDFGGQTCLPVSQLRQGIRAVRLRNRKGELYKSVRLLIQFHFLHNTL
ncbi:phosphoinositide phospholipase C 2-like [Vigna unguiculata]|uniref:Phosphoinositide phospholipase C n=1 Tax=Vigna unguiculata TaxID=3917 RepID=A0A4D6MMA4_VIGUN|nr:phosphoinositide phospholipase C 2-like [Vigna unguiculata]QCE00895.1 phospholipase C [Vigna unguiculata]